MNPESKRQTKNITKAKTQTILVPIGHKQSWILEFVISELVFWSGGQDKGYYWNLKVIHIKKNTYLRVCGWDLWWFFCQRIWIVWVLVIALGRIFVRIIDHRWRWPRRLSSTINHGKICWFSTDSGPKKWIYLLKMFCQKC